LFLGLFLRYFVIFVSHNGDISPKNKILSYISKKYCVSFLQPSTPANIDEVAAIGTALNVIITASDEDTNPDLSFYIDWENSRAAKQGFTVPKENFTG
jgi:hypothetical protein